MRYWVLTKGRINSLFLAIVSMLLFQYCSPTKSYQSLKTNVPPIIDGSMDKVWEKANVDSINGDMCGEEWSGPDDFSISFRSLWDDKNIFFFFEVRDDKKIYNDNSVVPWFDNDFIQIFFSPTFKKKVLDMKVLEFAFIYGVDSMVIAERKMQNIKAVKIDFKIKDSKKGYILELKIPWDRIHITPKEKLTIPFNIEATDSDKTDTVAGIYYGKEITRSWSPKTCRRTFYQTSNIGDLILVGSKAR